MKLIVVYDTNVLFSAAGWGGTPEKCVDLVLSRVVRGVTCAEILEEFADKLGSKLQWSDEEIAVVIESMLNIFEMVSITSKLRGPQVDRKDDKILECALVSNATHIVTGDRKHLISLRKFGRVEIVSPAELLRIVV
jgi:uncharacterized protein